MAGYMICTNVRSNVKLLETSTKEVETEVIAVEIGFFSRAPLIIPGKNIPSGWQLLNKGHFSFYRSYIFITYGNLKKKNVILIYQENLSI